MSAPLIPRKTPDATYEDAKVRHVANAMALTIAACEPGYCACGNDLPHHGARECAACWVAAVRRNLHRQREHRAMLAQAALGGDIDARAELDYLESDQDPADCRADRADQMNAQDKERAHE